MPETLSPLTRQKANSRREWILAYHAIFHQESEYLYDVSVKHLEQHIQLLAVYGKRERNSFAFTFDDGHLSNYENALGVLEKFGVRATFFLVAGLIGREPSYINWEQAREMVSAGHRIQSHGWSHHLLTTCNSKKLDEELIRSKGSLEERLGIEVDSLSVPGGRWDRRVIERSVRAGYKHLFHSNPWVRSLVIEGAHLRGRLMVTGRMTNAHMAKLIETGRTGRAYFRAQYTLKERLRSTLGEDLYFRLWCWKAKGQPAFGMGASIQDQGEEPHTASEPTGVQG